MRRLVDRLLSRWYVPRPAPQATRPVTTNTITATYVNGELVGPSMYYIDADGNYWPVSSSYTNGTPCS